MPKKKLILVLILVLLFILLWKLDFFNLTNNYQSFITSIKSHGYLGYLIFILFIAIASLFSVHASILVIITGIVYEPLLAIIISILGASLGAILSFLCARYLLKDIIEKKYANNKIYQKIDNGIKKNGTNYLIVTRLVILFPFNIQNYLYGLTNISLLKYSIITFITIIPGTALYVFLAHSLVANNFKLSIDVLIIFVIFSILLAMLAILPRKYFEKKGMLNND